MPRPKRFHSSVVFVHGLILVVASLATAAQGRVWPRPPADPLLELDSVLGRLRGFEVAVQGPLDGPPRTVQKLRRPTGVAFDARGRLLVTDSRQGLLLRIDPDLGVVLVYGSGTQPSLEQPMGIAVGDDGIVYVADSGLRQVVAFDVQGEVSAVYGEGLEEPTDVALSPDGQRLYVVDSRADRIAIFDRASRREVGSLGGRGVGVGRFAAPTAVEFDTRGNLLVVDQLNARVQIFDPSGAFTRALFLGRSGRHGRPQDVAADASGRVFVTDQARSLVQIYDADLDPLLNFGRNGLRDGEFLAVGSVAVQGDRMAVLDQAGGRLQLFRLHGVEEPAEPASEPESAPPPADPIEPESSDEPDPIEEAEIAAPPAEIPEPAERAVDETPVAQELVDLVRAWAAAWSAQDAGGYLGFYARTFRPFDGSSRDEWAVLRRARITGPSSIAVEIEILETRLERDTAEVTFLQSYTSDRFADRVRKRLRLVREEDGWKIDRELVLETL